MKTKPSLFKAFLRAVLLLLLAGCQSDAPALLPTHTAPPIPTNTVTPEPTPAPTSSTRVAGVTSAIPTRLKPVFTPTTTPSAIPVIPAPPGLIYDTDDLTCCSGDGTWLVGLDGKSQRISQHCHIGLSPTHLMAVDAHCDGTWLLDMVTGQVQPLLVEPVGWFYWSSDGRAIYYELERDIWIADLQTGERRNLTNTPDRDEYYVKIWHARPDILLLFSTPPPPGGEDWFEYGEGWFGYPTLVRLDGTQYTILTSSPSLSMDASSDGQSIAFSDDQGAWLFKLGSGKEPFLLQKYRLSRLDRYNVLSPSWSPDGKRLVWWVDHPEDTIWELVLVDLERESAQVVGRFIPYMYGHSWDPPVVEWSPDGRWFAFWSGDENYENVGIWLAGADGNDPKLLVEYDNQHEYDVSDKIWSPDSRWIAFTREEPRQQVSNWLVDVATGQSDKLDLPAGADIYAWINLQPLQIGQAFMITEAGANLNLHTAPSLASSSAAMLRPGDTFIPLDGPVSADDYNWWRIKLEGSVLEGWIVDIPDWYAPAQ